ncbi:MAG: hypothetical protein GDA65_19515 [Nitrospira sp. CR1.1]|nr:hypothetical protein [Nitrospira sp. CR1.1]
MDTYSSDAAHNQAPCDINRVELTGVVMMPLDLCADPYGALIVTSLLCSRSHPQMALWGTFGQQMYLFNVIALGSAGEQLATIQRGSVILIHGSLDYAYNPSAKSSESQWTQAVRAETITVLQIPSPEVTE